jgi:hypothetical protein
MTKQQHPVTPSWEQIDKWKTNRKCGESFERLLIMAAQWGADQELELCCEWLTVNDYDFIPLDLRAARRPKPPSLKQQALETLKYPKDLWSEAEVDTIRRALEALPDD